MTDETNIVETVKITPDQEEEKKEVIGKNMESLAAMAEELDELRKEAAVLARKKDIDYVEKIDDFIKTILDTVSEDKEQMKESIRKMIKDGNMKALKEMMVALGISVDKREALLSYDEHRRKKDAKKLKLQVLFRHSDGSQAGVSIEQD